MAQHQNCSYISLSLADLFVGAPQDAKIRSKISEFTRVIPTQNTLDWLRFHIEGCNFFIDCRHVANYDWSMESMSLRDFICHRQSFFSNKFQLIYAIDQSILILIMVTMGLTGLSYHILIVSLQFGFDSCNSLIGFIQDLGPSEVFATRLPQSPTWHTVLLHYWYRILGYCCSAMPL